MHTYPNLYLGITATGLSHAAYPSTYQTGDGMALALCRAGLFVNVEHYADETPCPVTDESLPQCLRCRDKVVGNAPCVRVGTPANH